MSAADDFTPAAEVRARQRATLFAALLDHPVSTIFAREVLGMAHPAGRVLELRKAGHAITTQSRTVYDAQGRPHRSAVYLLEASSL